MRYLFALLDVAASLVVGYSALLLGGMACDEGCLGSHWSRDPESWQWDAIQGLGLALFVTACVFAIGVAARRRTLSLTLLCTQAAIIGALLLTLAARDYGIPRLSPELAALASSPLVFGGAAIASLWRRPAPTSGP